MADSVDQSGDILLLELHGVACPHAFVKTKVVMETLEAGRQLKVIVDNKLSTIDLPRSALMHGYRVLSIDQLEPTLWAIYLQK